MTKNQGKKFAEDYRDLLSNIDNLSPKEVYNLSKSILDDKTLKIASGNKNFLKKGIDYYKKYGEEKFTNTKYAQGMMSHIRKALPFQEGFIGSKTSDLSISSKYEGYNRIVNELNNIRGLSLNGLVELSDEINNDPILKKVPGQESNLKVLQGFVKGYNNRVKKQDIEEAEAWLKGASSSGKIRLNSMLNILSKSYLPNLTSYLAKEKI